MIRGTTPIHTFNTNVDLRGCSAYVSYTQNGNLVVEKRGKDLTITENAIVTMLTQKETLRFRAGVPVKIQVRYVANSGIAEASNIIETTVEEVLKNGVIK